MLDNHPLRLLDTYPYLRVSQNLYIHRFRDFAAFYRPHLRRSLSGASVDYAARERRFHCLYAAAWPQSEKKSLLKQPKCS